MASLLVILLFFTNPFLQDTMQLKHDYLRCNIIYEECKQEVLCHIQDENLSNVFIENDINNVKLLILPIDDFLGKYIAGRNNRPSIIVISPVNLENEKDLRLTILHELLHYVDDKLVKDIPINFYYPRMLITTVEPTFLKIDTIDTSIIKYYSDVFDSLNKTMLDSCSVRNITDMINKASYFNINHLWSLRLLDNIGYFSNPGELFVRSHIMKIEMKKRNCFDVYELMCQIKDDSADYDFNPVILLMSEEWIKKTIFLKSSR